MVQQNSFFCAELKLKVSQIKELDLKIPFSQPNFCWLGNPEVNFTHDQYLNLSQNLGDFNEFVWELTGSLFLRIMFMHPIHPSPRTLRIRR